MNPKRCPEDYADIIGLQPPDPPHPMNRLNRAGQFAPFAALVGYGDLIDETARMTQERLPRSEDDEAALSRAVTRISSLPSPRVQITCFLPDAKKAGGSYVLLEGTIKQIDMTERVICLQEGSRISLDDVYELSEISD